MQTLQTISDIYNPNPYIRSKSIVGFKEHALEIDNWLTTAMQGKLRNRIFFPYRPIWHELLLKSVNKRPVDSFSSGLIYY